MDTVSKATRSRMMAAVRAKDTTLETAIRLRLFAQGFRYRLHAANLPGKPDMVFAKFSAVAFVNGCFWHYHGCSRGALPETRKQWWKKKLIANATRDARATADLRRAGWRVAVIWECAVRRPGLDREAALDRVCARLAKFLRSNRMTLVVSGPLPAGGC